MNAVMAIVTFGQWGIIVMRGCGQSVLFLEKFIRRSILNRCRWRDVFAQVYLLGTHSLPVILVAGGFIGMVVALQGFHTLQKFGAEAQLSQLLALSVFRELGPVMTALLYVGRAGSALTAEIGLMQVTEQIPAMEVMAIDPLRRVIFPRYLAGVISVPILTLIFDAVALWGGYYIAVIWLGLDVGTFWSNMKASVLFDTDVLNGLYKSVIFGLVVNWLALYHGYAAMPTAAGVGLATTRTVVISSLLILMLDFMMTAFMLGV